MIDRYYCHMVTTGGRNTLNELYKLIQDELNKHAPDHQRSTINQQPIYRDFRPGDIRHSNADISKAKRIVGYAPTHDIYRGMEEAIGWYIERIGKFSNEC